MTLLEHQVETFHYSFAAHEEARRASIQANIGLRHKAAFQFEEEILHAWKKLMVNAPVLLHNSLFLLFALADLILSWPMLLDIVRMAGIFPDVPALEFISVLVFCFVINAWAAVTAHFIGRGWSKEVQDWERWNYIFVKNRNQAPPNIISDEMGREIKRARFWALLSAFILIGMVAVILYYRILLAADSAAAEAGSGDFDEEITSGATTTPAMLAIILAYLPLAIILGEFFTGDYFWYSLRWWQTARSKRGHYKRFTRAKEQCGIHDQLAVRHAQTAKVKNEHLDLIGDLERAHLRFKHRSQQNDNYLDPLDHFKRIGFTFKYRNSAKPVENAIVFGILPNGAKTGDYRTDEHGKVTLHPDGDFDRLVAVQIDNREYLGPFQFNGEHYIDLPEYAVEAVGVNGRN